MQLAAGGTLNSGVNLKSNPGNIDIVYIGSSGLSGSLLDGYPLEPGENIFFETVNLNKLYSIGVTASAYKLNYIGS